MACYHSTNGLLLHYKWVVTALQTALHHLANSVLVIVVAGLRAWQTRPGKTSHWEENPDTEYLYWGRAILINKSTLRWGFGTKNVLRVMSKPTTVVWRGDGNGGWPTSDLVGTGATNTDTILLHFRLASKCE